MTTSKRDELYRRFQCARDLMIAVRDDPNSSLNLGIFYEVGYGTPFDSICNGAQTNGRLADILIASDAYHNGCTACFAGWLRIDPVARSILPPRSGEHPADYTRRFFAGMHEIDDRVTYGMITINGTFTPTTTENDVIKELQSICLETTGQRLSERWQQ